MLWGVRAAIFRATTTGKKNNRGQFNPFTPMSDFLFLLSRFNVSA